MAGLKRIILGITDLKNLFQSIKSKYALDFSNYALSSFKRRLEDFMHHYHIINFDDLVHKIENDPDFFQLMLSYLSVDTTEMFRDPEFWTDLRKFVLNRFTNVSEFRVWIPECVSGEELFTLLIILDQMNLANKTKICVSTLVDSNIERIEKANQDLKKMEISIGNYERFMEGESLSEYFINKTNVSQLKPELFVDVEIIRHNLFADKNPGIFDLILFRNKTLYYNPQLKIDALKKLCSALKPGGYIAIGIKETFEYPSWEDDFVVISDSERIYKKIGK